jgi:hypothetical protein
MTWTPYSLTDGDVVGTNFSASALVPLAVIENDRELRGDNARACGVGYPAGQPLEVRPPLTDGGIGPIMIPVMVPRPAWRCDIVLRITVSCDDDGPVPVTAWAMRGNDRREGQTETVSGTPVTLEAVIPGVSPGVGWMVCGVGLTVDSEDVVDVTEDGGVSVFVVTVTGSGMSGDGIVSPAGVEYKLPSGRSVYIGGTDAAGDTRIWPPVEQTEVLINQDTTGVRLPRVVVHGWSVTQRGAELEADPTVVDGAPLEISDLPRQRDRVTMTWANRSPIAVCAPVRDPSTQHGARGNEINTEAVVPVTDWTVGVRVAALVCRVSGNVSAALAWDAASTSSDLPQAESCIAMQVRTGVTTWTSQDLLFPGDLQAYASLDLESPVSPSPPYAIENAEVRASGSGVVHVAAVSVVTVEEVED